MTEQALIALHASIKHWKDVVAGSSTCIGPYDCALCGLFNTVHKHIDAPQSQRCNGCPVKDKTGKDFCLGSPYPDIEALRPLDNDFIPTAQKELDFLISLLPSGDTTIKASD